LEAATPIRRADRQHSLRAGGERQNLLDFKFASTRSQAARDVEERFEAAAAS